MTDETPIPAWLTDAVDDVTQERIASTERTLDAIERLREQAKQILGGDRRG